MNGWLKLHRALIDKPIWKNSTLEQRTILITLLCMANHKSNEWEFDGKIYEVKPGQFVTSLPSIVDKCNCKEITIQKVRTALARFEKFGFLTAKSTNKNRLITIVNWEFYQDKDEEDNRQFNRHLTGNQQALNRHLTANEEYKNIKNVKNDKNIAVVVNPNINVLDTAAAADDIADVNNKTAVSHYIKNINPTASPFEVENILKWIEALKGDEVVISAIDEAVMCNHRSLRYIEKILQRCEKQGIYTSEAFIAQKEISKKSRDGEMKVKQTAFNGYEQRDYTEEELEEIVKRKRRA